MNEMSWQKISNASLIKIILFLNGLKVCLVLTQLFALLFPETPIELDKMVIWVV